MTKLNTCTNTWSEDLWSLFIGDKIGSGMYRDVYECRPNSSLVVKVEKEHTFCNVREWTTWSDLESSKWADWLAPCICISNNGKFLLQSRADGILNKTLPDKIPDFLDDTHSANWGVFEKRLVCFDYALTRFVPDFKPKMIKHKWE